MTTIRVPKTFFAFLAGLLVGPFWLLALGLEIVHDSFAHSFSLVVETCGWTYLACCIWNWGKRS